MEVQLCLIICITAVLIVLILSIGWYLETCRTYTPKEDIYTIKYKLDSIEELIKEGGVKK